MGWDKEELALRNAIGEGAFDSLDLDSFQRVPNDETINIQPKGSCDKMDNSRVRALAIVSSKLMKEKSSMPWAECFDIIPSKSFCLEDDSQEYILSPDIHDDLK